MRQDGRAECLSSLHPLVCVSSLQKKRGASITKSKEKVWRFRARTHTFTTGLWRKKLRDQEHFSRWSAALVQVQRWVFKEKTLPRILTFSIQHMSNIGITEWMKRFYQNLFLVVDTWTFHAQPKSWRGFLETFIVWANCFSFKQMPDWLEIRWCWGLGGAVL